MVWLCPSLRSGQAWSLSFLSNYCVLMSWEAELSTLCVLAQIQQPLLRFANEIQTGCYDQGHRVSGVQEPRHLWKRRVAVPLGYSSLANSGFLVTAVHAGNLDKCLVSHSVFSVFASLFSIL